LAPLHAQFIEAYAEDIACIIGAAYEQQSPCRRLRQLRLLLTAALADVWSPSCSSDGDSAAKRLKICAPSALDDCAPGPCA
jgi:hypothetical protein